MKLKSINIRTCEYKESKKQPFTGCFLYVATTFLGFFSKKLPDIIINSFPKYGSKRSENYNSGNCGYM
jgi:hypothetical protein